MKLFTAVVSVVAVLSSALSGLGAVANVSVANFSFSPATSSINVGDEVVWTWASGASGHNVVSTSTTRAWLFPNSGGTTGNQNNTNVKSFPFVFTNIFNSAGSFPYQCTVHGGSFGMVGTITVTAAANQPPTVTITNPVDNATLSAPANVTIQASASDGDGTVTNVQFLVGSTILTNQASAPFSVTTNNLAAGSYTFSAVASDNLGAKNTNSVSVSVVAPVQTTFGAMQSLNSTNFQFSYVANVGLSYVIQLSTNLGSTNWFALATNTAASNPVVFVDNHATNNPGFYRVGRLPNP